MFGKEPSIIRHFPNYFLDYQEARYLSVRRIDSFQSNSGDWTGNLCDFFSQAYSNLAIDIKKPFLLEGGFRIDYTPVHKAVNEALTNCIVNADFNLPGGIVIHKDWPKIVIQNPGSSRTSKTQMLRGGLSDPRNKGIMKMFNLISRGKRAGTGIPYIYSTWKEKGWPEPIIEEPKNPGRISLTLFFTEKQTEDAPKQAKPTKTLLNKNKILAYLRNNGNASSSELSEHLGLSPARTRAILKKLTADGPIFPDGNGRKRRYKAYAMT